MTEKIFQEYKLNSELTLANRIIMAPLTRCFADEKLVPTQQMVDYYARRADVGLIISEAAIIDPIAQGYPNTPGIFSKAQVKGWKKVTKAVHERGGKMFCQLWHCGRTAHSYYSGKQPVAPSVCAWHGKVPRSKDLEYEMPRSLTTKEVKRTIKKYIKAAKNAMKAGFDGVEIHGANGYLIDQFLRQDTNKRDDRFGGSTKKRTRFALRVVDGVVNAIGAEKTAIRLSPQAYVHLQYTKGDEKTYRRLLKRLNKRNICYVHLGAFDDTPIYDYLGNRKASEFIRRFYKGTFIACGSYTLEIAKQAIEQNKADLVAIGRPIIANPDFIKKAKSGEEMVPYDMQMLRELV